MAEFMIIYHFLSTFTRYLFEFDKSLLKGVPFPPGSTRFSPVFLTVKSHRLSQRFDPCFFFLYNCGISVFLSWYKGVLSRVNVSKRDGFRLRILLPRNNSSPCVKRENRQKKNMVLSEDSTNGRLLCPLLFAIVRMNLTLTERFIT